jgi:hypothetical protein
VAPVDWDAGVDTSAGADSPMAIVAEKHMDSPRNLCQRRLPLLHVI